MRNHEIQAAKAALLLCLLLALAAGLAGKAVTAPIAPVWPDTTEIHGITLIDDWAWLRDRENPDLRDVLDAEAAYTQACLKPSRKLAKKLYRYHSGGYMDVSVSYPVRYNGYRYYYKNFANKPYSAYYRVRDLPGAKEELILDENKLAKGHDYFDCGFKRVSPDASKLAFSVDFTGSEEYRLQIKDLATGRTKTTPIANFGDAVWLADSRRLAVTTVDSLLRTDSAYIYDTATDSLRQILYEVDTAWDLTVFSTTDKDLIILLSTSGEGSESWYLEAGAAVPVLKPLIPRSEAQTNYPDHLAGEFWALTDADHPEFSVCRFTPGDFSPSGRQTVIPGSDGQPIGYEIFLRDTVAIIRRHQGFERIEIYSRPEGNLLRVIQPSAPSDLDFWSSSDPLADSLLYTIENEITTPAIVKHHLASGRETVVDPPLDEVNLDYNQYRSELLWVDAPDGVKVPLSLLYRRDLDYAVPHPVWLSGYGAYGDTNDPYFWDGYGALLDRGFIYATAHVRGGGELGKNWYEQGKTALKANTFTDFIACMDYLIDRGYTTPGQLVIEGGSAGGMLIGAVLNLAPEKLRLAIADVPFVDVANTMLDPDLPLTLGEYGEWGDPNDEEQFRNILKISPYDNVRPAKYPHVLVSTAWNDVRVGYWEPLKWVQKLRQNNLGDSQIILRMDWDGGHLGGDNYWWELARTQAYALKLLGLEK